MSTIYLIFAVIPIFRGVPIPLEPAITVNGLAYHRFLPLNEIPSSWFNDDQQRGWICFSKSPNDSWNQLLYPRQGSMLQDFENSWQISVNEFNSNINDIFFVKVYQLEPVLNPPTFIEAIAPHTTLLTVAENYLFFMI